MAVSFNKEVISEAIQEVIAESTGKLKTVTGPSGKTVAQVVTPEEEMEMKKKGAKIAPMEEDHHENPNDDSNMAKSQLYAIAKYAIELLQLIKDGDQLDAWVQAKITKAADYVDAVQHYLEGEEYLDNNHGESDAELNELFGRVKNKTVNYKGHDYKILDIDSAGTFTLIDPQDPSAEAFHVNRAQMKAGRVPDVKAPEVEDVPLVNLKEEDDIEAPTAGFEDDSAKAPKGDKKLNKAASKNDKIISTYKKIKPFFKKAAAGDKEALAIVKANQDVIKAYKKLTQTHLAENKATCCGKCGRTHVKGTECKKPFLTGQDHCRVR